ncbi:vitamin K-dependent gamma-carboxylase [Trichonephila clavipes]|uniref:Vitamin K-dependent gamma-carboxylase n=1 Tax=Trichonephila clavipes TaxID=2585209 RepID=A0A8X6UVA9_TRICX|nr:vitamin K-dependent gamma-carboxylase [Trichonephila clavipes]
METSSRFSPNENTPTIAFEAKLGLIHSFVDVPTANVPVYGVRMDLGEIDSQKKRGDVDSPTENEKCESGRKWIENCVWVRDKILKELGISVEDLSSFESFTRLLHRPRDPSGLAVIRMLYGFLMIIDVHHERGLSSADSRWGNPAECRFPFFNFLKPLSLEWMIMIYLLMLLGATGVMLGYRYRLSCLCFLISYWYIFFLDKSHWNNHSYLFGLIGIQLMAFGKKDEGKFLRRERTPSRMRTCFVQKYTEWDRSFPPSKFSEKYFSLFTSLKKGAPKFELGTSRSAVECSTNKLYPRVSEPLLCVP